MQTSLVIDDRITIPRVELRFSFARSSGPGGQNVNKLNTKAVLHWDLRHTACLPEAVRRRMIARCANRINERGELVLSSDRHRVQGRNVADCLERLRSLVKAATREPRSRKATRPTRRSVESRLESKRRQSNKKAMRRAPHDDGA